jgi:hypothetical protein
LVGIGVVGVDCVVVSTVCPVCVCVLLVVEVIVLLVCCPGVRWWCDGGELYTPVGTVLLVVNRCLMVVMRRGYSVKTVLR